MQQSSSQNQCYSTNQQYFLDICRSGQFDQIKQFISTLSSTNVFNWEWISNSGDNFIHMLAGNNYPEIFQYLINIMRNQHHLSQQKILQIINKQNSTANTPLHYAVITNSKQMLIKLLQYKADPNIQNQFNRTPLAEAEMIEKFQLAEILAPVTKQDIQKLKKQFGGLDVCGENDGQSDQDQNQNQEQKEKKQQKKLQ